MSRTQVIAFFCLIAFTAVIADSYDYIVVGSGPGGSPVARRLAEAGYKVLVLERGQNVSGISVYQDPYVRPGRFFDSTVYSEPWVHHYYHERDPRLNQDQNYLAAWGGALGGSTTLNGQMSVRGDRQSYDEWTTEFGLKNWGYFGLLPYLVNIENNARFNASDNTHLFSNQGPVPVTPELTYGTYNNLYLDSLNQSPVHHVAPNPYCSSNSDLRGSCFVDKTMDHVHRSRRYASENYIDPILGSGLDLTVITSAVATTLVASNNGKKVTGVNALINGVTQTFSLKSSGEVILAAGPFETPKLLMVSGYGPSDQLTEFGIQQKMVIDGIGRNLHDHPGFIYINLGNITEPKNQITYPPAQSDIDQWVASASGKLAQGSDPITAFYSSGVNGAEVDVQISFGDGVPLFALPDPNAYFIECYNVKPKSRGRLTLRSANPVSDPVINLGYLTDPNGTDVQVLLECMKFAHQLSTDTAHSSLANWTIGNVLPGLPETYWELPPSVLDPILESVLFATVSQGYHFGGTVAMGSVLDETLQIPTVTGLRVVGVSIQPKVVGFNPQMFTYSASEKLADLIKKDRYQSVNYRNPLTVTSLCHGQWSISNTNTREAVFDWVATSVSTNQVLYQGTYHVAAGSSAVIYSDAEPTRVKMTVSLYGVVQGTATNNSC